MKKKKRICLLMALVVVCAGFAGQVAMGQEVDSENVEIAQEEQFKSGKETFEKAETAIANKDFQTAIVYLTGYISSKPKKYEAYKLRGDAFYALRQYKLAQMDYQAAIDLKKDDDKFKTGAKVLGAVVLGVDKQEQYQNPELGNLYASLMYAQKALNLPAYEVSYQNAIKYNSHIYLPQPKSEDIQKINFPQKYGKILNPQGVDTYIYGAIDNIESGNFLEASYKAQYIITNFPKYYLGYYLLGVAMNGLDKEKDAIDAFENALKLNSYDFESLASLGQIYYKEAEKTFSVDIARKSVDYFTKAIKYNPNSNLYYYYIAQNELRAGDYDSAISNFNTAVRLKSDDYNSYYYKLIAQYMKGEYSAVVEGCTNLLYRHVSNTNSVLYLRALANNKLQNVAFSIADIETAQNNMGDIYNADVKTLSTKEKTLDNYLYYLKAQILSSKGFGVKADLAKAYQNSVISVLSKGGNIDNSTLRLSSADIENQYDYIITTFDNLNVSFEYLNPDYKFVSMKSQKLQNNDTEPADIVQTPLLSLEQSASANAIVSSENSVSIAEMLATKALQGQGSRSENAINDESVKLAQTSIETTETEVLENTSKTSPLNVVEEDEVVVLDPDTILFKAPVQKETESFEIKYKKAEAEPVVEQEQVSATSDEVKDLQNDLVEPVKTVAEEIKETLDFKITYENKTDETLAQAEISVQENGVEDQVQDTQLVAQQTSEVESNQEIQQNVVAESAKNEEKIVNKPAQILSIRQTNMNLSGFGSVNKDLPEIKEDDEVIVFVPEQKSFIKEIEQNISSESYEISTPVTITDDFSSLKENEEKLEVVQNIQESEPVLIEPENVNVPEELLVQSEVPVTEVEQDDQEQKVNESLPIVDEKLVMIDEDKILEQEGNKKKAKKQKEKKDVKLKDFLSDEPLDITVAKEKTGKAKKHKELKDFLADSSEVMKEPEKTEKKEMELKDFLADQAVSESNVKKEKHSIFKRKDKKVTTDLAENEVEQVVPIEDEQLVSDNTISEVVQEEEIEEPVQVEQKTKKSWFSFFKRNKKSKVSEQELIDEIPQSESVEILEEIPEKPVSEILEPEVRAYDYEDTQAKVDEILQQEDDNKKKPAKRFWKKSKVEHAEEE